MRRLTYGHHQARPHQPAAPGARTRGSRFSLDELTASSAEPIAAVVGTGLHAPAGPQSFDDDPLDALLSAAALAGQGGGMP